MVFWTSKLFDKCWRLSLAADVLLSQDYLLETPEVSTEFDVITLRLYQHSTVARIRIPVGLQHRVG